MRFVVSSSTDMGLNKAVNQDSVYVNCFPVSDGEAAFAVICDGMGGYSEGEVASASVVSAFVNWMTNTFPALICGSLDEEIIREQWGNIIAVQNNALRAHGAERGITLGTTATVLLITEQRWFCLNVGDSRAYELFGSARQLTRDHSFVASEVERGNMTAEEAKQSPKRNILMQCIGIAESVEPDFFFGAPGRDAMYLLCTDGFRHYVSQEELHEVFRTASVLDEEELRRRERYLVDLNRQRGETDDISVITVALID